MKIIYKYAQYDSTKDDSREDSYDFIIGNIMRQVLEAYSTFTYKMGMSQLTTDESVLDEISDEKLREYFENSMYRLLLNNDSHKLDEVRSMTSDFYFNNMSYEEKSKIARDVICLPYLLNKQHVLSHLYSGVRGASKADMDAVVQNWIADIPV